MGKFIKEFVLALACAAVVVSALVALCVLIAKEVSPWY